MLSSDYILVYDSGNGGKYVLQNLKKKLPLENFILFKDTEFCPYGNKKILDLKENITKKINYLLSTYKIKLIVIACNTISSLFKTYLLNKFTQCNFLFVNPKITTQMLKNKTLILGTTNTIKNNKRIQFYKNNKNLYVLGLSNLAKIIDDNIKKLDTILPILRAKLAPYINFEIKNIVLACTHYNYIKKQLKTIFHQVKFYESSMEVSTLAKRLLENLDLININNKKQTVLILNKI